MFVKIKQEPNEHTIDSTSFKDATFFNIDDNATILAMKLQIEKYIDVIAERQEIKTLTRTYQNHERIWNICDTDNAVGTAMMLYIYEGEASIELYGNEPYFLCFLQLYTDKEGALQIEYQQKVKDSANLHGCVIDLDTESEQDANEDIVSETSTSSSSSSSSSASDTETETNSSDSSDESTVTDRKRPKTTECETKPKKQKRMTVFGSLSPTLCTYLDQFPKCSDAVLKGGDADDRPILSAEATKKRLSFSPNGTTLPQPSDEVETKNTPKNTSPSLSDEEDPKNSANSSCTSSSLSTPATTATISYTKPSSSSNAIMEEVQKVQVSPTSTTTIEEFVPEKPPCAATSPDHREFIVVISKLSSNDSKFSQSDSKDFFEKLYQQFRESTNLVHLQFAENAVQLYDGVLWIGCESTTTFDWIFENISKFRNFYQIQRLRDHLGLHSCSVVVPVVVGESNDLSEVFNLLEKQNTNFNTEKWVVKQRHILKRDECEKFVSSLCDNEMLALYIDEQSKEELGKLHFQLKYVFWRITFEMN